MSGSLPRDWALSFVLSGNEGDELLSAVEPSFGWTSKMSFRCKHMSVIEGADVASIVSVTVGEDKRQDAICLPGERVTVRVKFNKPGRWLGVMFGKLWEKE